MAGSSRLLIGEPAALLLAVRGKSVIGCKGTVEIEHHCLALGR